MARVKVKMLKPGSQSLLTSEEVLHDIKNRAQAVAAAAGEGFEGRARVGRKRVLGAVSATSWKAYRAESRGHALTRAMDAAR